MPPAQPSPLLADLVVLAHLAYVGFVASGYLAVPLGAVRGWRWVRSRAYRRLHLAAIALVALEALGGVVCPLTLVEAELRGGEAPQKFMGRLVHALLFYDLPGWVFTLAYVLLVGAALALYRLVPPGAAAPGAVRSAPIGSDAPPSP